MRKIVPPLMLALLASTAVLAAEPAPDGSELRVAKPLKLTPDVRKQLEQNQIRHRKCGPNERTEITGIIGQPTTITFPQGDSIYRIVQTRRPDGNGGFSEEGGWWVPKPAADANEEDKKIPITVATMWPIKLGFSTMTIVTIAAGAVQTSHPFRLYAINDRDGAADDPGITLNLYCDGRGARHDTVIPPTHPASDAQVSDDPPARRVSTKRQHKATEAAAALALLRAQAFNSDGTCHYKAKSAGPSPIEPRCPLDNRRWTVMRFQGQKKPAVYTVSDGTLCGFEDGTHESLARQHASGDFIVVEDTAPRFCLRLGNDVLQIDNQAYAPLGQPDSGSLVDGVKRKILKAAR